LRIVDVIVAGEIESGLFAVDFDFAITERGLEPVSRPLIVCAKNYRIAAIHLEPQLIIAFRDGSKLLADRRLKLLVDATMFCAYYYCSESQRRLVYFERQRAVLN